MFAPLEVNQKDILSMLDIVPPSIECKMIECQYSKLLNQVTTYRDHEEFIRILTKRLQFFFYQPECKIMNQNDNLNSKSVFITGTGTCDVYQNFHYTQDVLIGRLDPGYVFGENQYIFSNTPHITLIAQ